MGSSERYLVISADSHAGPPLATFRDYVERGHLAAFDDFVEETNARRAALLEGMAGGSIGGGAMPPERIQAFASHESLQPGGHPGLSDPDRRRHDMDVEGISADVIFPDFPHLVSHEPPFGAVTAGHKLGEGGISRRSAETYDPELQWVGARAYNRWLVDFCSGAPERHAGIAIVPLHDVAAAVKEIHWARQAGLTGGILLPGMTPELPGWNAPVYEPVWTACEELEMPVNTHSGGELPDYGPGPDAILLLQTEVMFLSHRPLWWLMWGGVFERHPGLVFVLTEQMADWVPGLLRDLETQLSSMGGAAGGHGLSLGPREYWERQCFVGASFLSPGEARMRDEIGLGTICWASDYPHIEGSWPYSRESQQHACAGIPEADVRTMLGENAARAYGFDLEALRPLADQIGPTVEKVAEPLAEIPADYIGQAFR